MRVTATSFRQTSTIGVAAILSVALLAVFALPGCATKGFKAGDIAKSDIDTVSDVHLHAIDADLRELTVKLYKRNPRELKKAEGQTVDSRLDQLFGKPGPLRFEELDGKHSTDAMMLCFDDHYKGDRVFATMAGLVDMLHKSYGYHTEFFVLDELDQQKFYDSARNIEILVWRLNHKRDPQGNSYLLTNDTTDTDQNLSFERLFGKMISMQDMMAAILAGETQRSINHVVTSAATMMFLPI